MVLASSQPHTTTAGKDATLSTRGAYAGKWNSAQAEQVRKLRAERDALSRQLDQIIEG